MSRKTLSVTLLGAVGLSAGCQPQTRTLRSGNNAATLNLTIELDSLAPGDRNRSDFVYELSDCVGIPAAIDGTLQPAGTGTVTGVGTSTGTGTTPISQSTTTSEVVAFTAVGLAPGVTGCQLRIKDLAPTSDIQFNYETNTLYWTQYVTLTLDQTGALVASIDPQRLYSNKPTATAAESFTLQIPVTFPAPETGAPLTGAVVCNPAIANPGTYQSSSPTGGSLSFLVAINQATDFACTDLYVNVAGILQKYHAPLTGSAATVHGTSGATIKTASVALTLQTTTTTTGTGAAGSVSIATTGSAQCNAQNEQWDEASHQCVCILTDGSGNPDPNLKYDVNSGLCTAN